MSTNAENAAEIERLERIRGSIAGLDQDDAELVDGILRKCIDETKTQHRTDRLTGVIDVLFPSYDFRLKEDERPPRWPERRLCLSNGVSIKDHYESSNGLMVTLESYVGGGEYDSFEFKVLNEWLEMDDPKEYLQDLCRKMAKEKADELNRQKVAEAERNLSWAEAEVARLRASLG